MKKSILLLILIFSSIMMMGQIPYFAGTPGKHNLYGYTSQKYRPMSNYNETYTTFQYGISDRLAVGTDLYTGPGSNYVGYSIRANVYSSNVFNIGLQVTPSFDMDNKYKLSYVTNGLYMNGNITRNGNLFWVSNTWYSINNGSENTIDQWWYLGYYIPISKSSSITPMVGLLHDWKFEYEPSLAVGAYYSYNKFNFYAWADKLNQDQVRFVIGVDFKLSTND